MTGKRRTSMLLLTAILATSARAQSTTPSTSAHIALAPPTSQARDPLALPGDNLPPSLAAMLAPPRPQDPKNPPPSDEPLPPAPPLGLSLKGIQAALASCHAQGFEVGAAVANSVGVIVAGLQADKAHPGRVYNAMRKNLVALEFAAPNSTVRDRLRAGDYATLARVKPSMTLFPGAVPLFSAGKLVGAIAVSGGPAGEIDEGCAAAGAAAIKDDLR